VYDGCWCPSADSALDCLDLGCAGGGAKLDIRVIAGNQYMVRVGGSGDQVGPGWLTISCVPNDSCAEAIPVEVPSVTAGSGLDAEPDPTAPYCGFSMFASTVWYTVIGTGNTITASLCDPGMPGLNNIAVYSGPCEALSCLTSNSGYCGDQSQVSWCSQAGAEYQIVVDGADFVLTVTEANDACAGLLGDIDGDGDVDLNDFSTFANCFSGGATTPPPSCAPAEFAAADLDADGDTDLNDFASFANNFTG